MTLVTGRASTTCVLLVGLDGSVGTSKKTLEMDLADAAQNANTCVAFESHPSA
jgi:hypothetical protein